jgi:hypothetical protein
MSHQDLSTQLTLASRRRRGQLLAAEWLRSLGAALGTVLSPSSLLGIEETEAIKAQCITRLVEDPEVARKVWPDPMPQGPPAPDEVVDHVARLAQAQDFDAILFAESDYNVGATRVSANAVLRNANAVWQLTRHDVMFVTPDLADGLCLEYNHVGDHTAEGHELGTYELRIWGRLAR